MTVWDEFRVVAHWRPPGDTLVEGAERVAATVRAVALAWPECRAWSTVGKAPPLAPDDPELAGRLLPKLRAARDRDTWHGSMAFGDPDLDLHPRPYRPVSIGLFHNNPLPTHACLTVRAQQEQAACLDERPEKFVALLHDLVRVWDAPIGYVDTDALWERQPMHGPFHPRFGWATWSATGSRPSTRRARRPR